MELWQLILIIAGILLIFGTAAWAGISAAPYVPTRTRDVERIITLAEIQPGDAVVDVGSGDGRIVFAAAAAGANAVGYEISFVPWIISVIRASRLPYRSRIKIYWKSFYQVDLSQFDVVCAFLMPGAIQKLAQQLERQPKAGRRVLCFAFAMKQWTPDKQDKPTENQLTLWRYRQ